MPLSAETTQTFIQVASLSILNLPLFSISQQKAIYFQLPGKDKQPNSPSQGEIQLIQGSFSFMMLAVTQLLKT